MTSQARILIRTATRLRKVAHLHSLDIIYFCLSLLLKHAMSVPEKAGEDEIEPRSRFFERVFSR